MSMERSTQTRDVASGWQAPSLRGRISFLAAAVVVLLTVTLCILLWVLRSTQANTVARSQRHLEAVARSMANAYQSRIDRTVSLSHVDPRPNPLGPDSTPGEIPALPPPLPPPGPHPPGDPVHSSEDRALAALTSRVLQLETGIEGGFFRSADQRLVGYAFPTHEGPGDPKALPGREMPNIQSVATNAFSERQLQEDQFFGTHDVVLFVAIPVCDTRACADGPVGSAWLMQRLPGAETDRKRALLWSAFGFGIVACVTVILAFLALRQVGRGTQAVLDRLTGMESNLAHQPRPASVKLAEFHRVLDGLDRLGETLRGQMERERELQSRLRQNERLAAIGQLAAGVAHELRNPLATIRLRAQMAQRKTQEETTTQASSVILAEVDRLDAIIERLLDFSRPIRLNAVTVDVSELAEAAVQRWAARHSEVAVRYRGDSEVCAVADPMRLEQVFDNLLDNAVNQMKEARVALPSIEVACRKEGTDASVEVVDNGGGFTPAALRNATEPFFTTRAKGTGLGLAITQEIVHALRGTLTLSNTADGAMVRIQIPESESC
jgi:signal transduction histidine kinase